MEPAQETARQQEASMARLRGYLDDLPPEIDTRDFRQLLEDKGSDLSDSGAVALSLQ